MVGEVEGAFVGGGVGLPVGALVVGTGLGAFVGLEVGSGGRSTMFKGICWV